jgi:hypothetical protein
LLTAALSTTGIWVQRKNLVVRDVPLEHYWESADGQFKTAQIVQPWSKVKEILRDLHIKSLGKHCGVNKTLYKNKE